MGASGSMRVGPRVAGVHVRRQHQQQSGARGRAAGGRGEAGAWAAHSPGRGGEGAWHSWEGDEEDVEEAEEAGDGCGLSPGPGRPSGCVRGVGRRLVTRQQRLVEALHCGVPTVGLRMMGHARHRAAHKADAQLPLVLQLT